MVILKGHVRSGRMSTEDDDSMIEGAAIIQGDAIVYTSSDGSFYTSADTTLNTLVCSADEHQTANYSIAVFATIYDPEGVISGALTRNADIVSMSGATIITDTGKLFMSGALIGRMLSMRSGVYDGFSGVIVNNTATTVQVGGEYVTSGYTSGGGWI